MQYIILIFILLIALYIINKSEMIYENYLDNLGVKQNDIKELFHNIDNDDYICYKKSSLKNKKNINFKITNVQDFFTKSSDQIKRMGTDNIKSTIGEGSLKKYAINCPIDLTIKANKTNYINDKKIKYRCDLPEKGTVCIKNKKIIPNMKGLCMYDLDFYNSFKNNVNNDKNTNFKLIPKDNKNKVFLENSSINNYSNCSEKYNKWRHNQNLLNKNQYKKDKKVVKLGSMKVSKKIKNFMDHKTQNFTLTDPNSWKDIPGRAPACIPSSDHKNNVLPLFTQGTPLNALEYTSVGGILPKFTYAEIFDPKDYSEHGTRHM